MAGGRGGETGCIFVCLLCHAAIKHSPSQRDVLPHFFSLLPSTRGAASLPEGLRARLKSVTERFTTVALWQHQRRKMAATLVARGSGPAPAWGPEAITPDWENREVSTGVRRDSGFKRCAQVLMRWKGRPESARRTGERE